MNAQSDYVGGGGGLWTPRHKITASVDHHCKVLKGPLHYPTVTQRNRIICVQAYIFSCTTWKWHR